MAQLSIKNIYKKFGTTEVLKGINIEVADGEFLILVGASGCGKSTLLSMIAGLDDISSGEISIGDKVVNDVSPKDRDIAMVFQSYALYPSMTVRENIEFGLRMKKMPKPERDAVVARVAKTLQIDVLLDRRPAQLSGGQRQRVAMGRALARDPAVFLFDEPLSNLDAKLRVEMRAEIKALHQRTKTTIVYVTHDQVEAMTLGDRIAVMRDGVVQQLGTPAEIYERPANLYVAGFIGAPSMNLLDAQHVSRKALLGVRPEHFMQVDASAADALAFTIDMLEPTGADTFAYGRLQGQPQDKRVAVRLPPKQSHAVGSTVFVQIDASVTCLFDAETGVRID
jgi:multiple sugar transport system ATP-binding protein